MRLKIFSSIPLPNKYSSYRQVWKPMLLIFTFALVLRLLVFLIGWAHADATGHNPAFTWYDTGQYVTPAKSLIEHGTFSVDNGGTQLPYFVRPPLYPLFIAVCFASFGERPISVLLPQLLLSALGCSFVYWLCAMLFGHRAGLIAGLLTTLDQSLLAYSSKIMSEVFALSLFVISSVLVLLFVSHRRYVWLILGAVLLALSALSHTSAQYYWVVPATFLVVISNVDWKNRLIAMGLFVITYLAIVGVWQSRNYREFGIYELASKSHVFTFNAALVLWHQQTEREFDDVSNEFHRSIRDLFIQKHGESSLNWNDPATRRAYVNLYEHLETQESIRVFRKHFGTYSRLAFVSFLRITILPLPYAELCRFVSPRDLKAKPVSFRAKMIAATKELLRGQVREFWLATKEVPFCKIVGFTWNVLYWFLTIPVGLLGAYLLCRHCPMPYVILLLGTIAYFAVTTSIAKAGDGMQRYRIRVVPYIYCVAALGWCGRRMVPSPSSDSNP